MFGRKGAIDRTKLPGVVTVFAWLVALAMIAPVSAADFCVGSEANIQAALNTARTNGEPDTIKIWKGTLALTAGLAYDTQSPGSDNLPLTISGGYDGACSARTGTTMLHGQDLVRVLHLNLNGADTITIDHVAFYHGKTPALDPNGGGLRIDVVDPTFNAEILIDSVKFIDNSTKAEGGALYVAGSGAVLTVRNSLFVGNKSGSAPAAWIDLTGRARFVNNTIVNNTVTTPAAGHAFEVNVHSGGKFWFANNILWGNQNVTADIYMDPAGSFYELLANDIGSYAGATPDSSIQIISADPEFAECVAPCFDRFLKSSSQLIDAGSDNVDGLPSTDIVGGPRIVGLHADIGAYEFSPSPVAVDDAIDVEAGSTATILIGGAASVLANDHNQFDPGVALTASIVSGPSGGQVVLNADGTFEYTEQNGGIAQDAFQYKACSSAGKCSTAKVTITISPTSRNHLPIAVGDGILVSPSGSTKYLIGGAQSVLDNDYDVDGDALEAKLLRGPEQGILTFEGNGHFEYTNIAPLAQNDFFLYEACDARGAC
jgi:hypothetical protein